MIRQTLAALAACCLFVAAARAQTIAITGGRVFPVSGPPIDNGTVLIRDGKIVQVGANVTIPTGAQRVDATGKWVTPGLVNAETQLGLFDIAYGSGPTDNSAKGRGDALTPSFTAWEGVNPRSVYVAPARQGGVTNVTTGPAIGGGVSGPAGGPDPVGGTVSDMVRKAPSAMFASKEAPSRSVSTTVTL